MTSGTSIGQAWPGNTYPAIGFGSGAIIGRALKLIPYSITTLKLTVYSQAGN